MITIRLSESELRAAGACVTAEGHPAHWTTWLRETIAQQNEQRARLGRRALPHLRVRCTPLHLLWLSVQRPSDYSWAVQRGILPGLALVGANLARANLGGANLVGADLGGANLGSANLVGADLGGANLGSANLVGANLVGANLGGANLGGANLGSANLGGANLVGANLARANLVGAYRGSSPAPEGLVVDADGYLRRRP